MEFVSLRILRRFGFNKELAWWSCTGVQVCMLKTRKCTGPSLRSEGQSLDGVEYRVAY